MASEDVIELGSSDDEAEPAPKKIKPNAMVHIPHKISGVAIEPAKPSLPSLHKKLSGRSITIKKVQNPAAKVKNNSILCKTLQKPVASPVVKSVQKLIKQGLNPISLNMSNSQVAINRVPATFLKEPIKVAKLEGISLNSLPSSVTVKKTLPPHKHTNIMRNKINKNIKILPNIAMRPKVTMVPNPVASKSSVGDILTVELDDDDANSTPDNTNGPQWYLRPEEQKQQEKMEEQNNTEPKSSNIIEITIEDSPVKPITKMHEIGTEFAITIEDSPIKFTESRKKTINCSDEENKEVHKTPKTKKKLEYPKNNVNDTTKTVEIEIEPIELNAGGHVVNMNEVEVIHSENHSELNSPQTKEKNIPEISAKTIATEESQPPKSNDENNGENEFHPVYQSFIDLCFELENSDDMQKIVDKKIKGYYKQVPKEYRESEEFLDMVSSKIISMKAGPERMYLYIKDVVDELNFKRKSYKPNAPPTQETIINDKEAEKFFYGDESEFDSKRQRQIRKLEKTLKKLHRAIQKLEEQEVDFEDEEDSVYLLTERYKERMIRVHAKFCQLTNTKMPSEPRVHIEARPGQPSGPAKRLEKMINKKVPIGTPLPFPDFHDVLRCVREANDEDKLSWNEADIMDEARDLFIRCGRKLQRRRQENEWRLAASRISAELDPATDSDELKKKLEQNKLLAVKKETELFNKYADKQNQMKLEAVEIGDKEAEESPVESEDDDVQEDVSLENSEKRKERLKRLLQEKITKDSAKNEDSTNDLNGETKLNDMNEKECTDINKKNEECTSIEIKSVESLTETINIDDKVQSLSDDSSKINSDMDELHLLQKLHSGNEVNDSTQDSSDSDSLIAISDSLDSSSDSNKQGSEDVISIENSSYSEPEVNEVENVLIINPTECSIPETVKETCKLEIECSTTVGTEKKFDKSNNEEYNESVENILLASSDEECDSTKKLSENNGDGYVNLNDDAMSIGETIIEINNSTVNIHISKEEDDIHLKKRSNETSSVEASPEVNDEQKAVSADLQEVDINDENIKSNEPVLIDHCMNKLKENNITSTINDASINEDILLSDADKQNISNGTQDKQNTECDSVEEVVGSTTEAMEVVTTTSPCDDANG